VRGVEPFLVVGDLLERGLAEPQVLRQMGSLIGRMVLAREQQNGAVAIVLANAVDRPRRGQAPSDDDVGELHGPETITPWAARRRPRSARLRAARDAGRAASSRAPPTPR